MLKLIKSTFYNEKKTKTDLVAFIRDAEILSFGKYCNIFEEQFAAWQGRKYCVFLNSGSSANLAIIQGLLNLHKLKHGDYVGFSALTWSTNAMPLLQLGLEAIPIDVELDTLNVSSKKLQQVLELYPLKMLFLTNLLGLCDDIDMIRQICEERHIILIEDNCESLGSVYKGKKHGNYGLASTFSFYVGHHLSTIEGGVICTDSEQLANMLRIVRAHGWDRNLSEQRQLKLRKKHKVNSTFYSRYTFYDLGYNLRPTEINGFLGTTQLNYLDKIIAKRQRNFLSIAPSIYQRLDKYFSIKYTHMDFHSNFAVPVICRSSKIRDEMVERCNDVVEIRPIVGGDITKQPFFRKHSKLPAHNPNAELIHNQGLYFGNNPELSQKDVAILIDVFT